MSRNTIIMRETLVSAVINSVITVGFFFALFGLTQPVPAEPFGRDFLPQSFMVALMGTLIPGLLLRRAHGGSIKAVVLRSAVLAAAALAVGIIVFFAVRSGAPMSAFSALIIKVAYSVALSAIVTPIAVRAVLASSTKVPA